MKTHGNLMCLVLALALLPGCRRGGADGFVTKGPDGAINLAVGATADLTEPVEVFRLEDYYDLVGEILPDDEDPRTFMTSMEFFHADDETVLVQSRDRVVRLSQKDGSFVCEYGRKGRGPGEYTQPLLCFVQDGEVYVNDIMSRCHVYALEDGRLLREFPLFEKNSQFSIYAPLDKDHGVICYSSLAGQDHLFDVVDASRQVVRAGTLPMAKVDDGGIRVGFARRMDGKLCVPDDGPNRVLHQVAIGKDAPWVRLDKGSYTPYSSTGDHWLIEDEWMSFGPFFYVTLRRKGGLSAIAVYDLKRRALALYKAAVDAESYRTCGLPYTRDGQTLYLIPDFGDREVLVCHDLAAPDNHYCFRLKK